MLEHEAETITLVGAGLVGSLLAITLARRGYNVEIYERRPDMRRKEISAGRSINLALSVRGIHALEQVGIGAAILDQGIAMMGRTMHSIEGGLSYQPYGKDQSQYISSISRSVLNQALMTEAEKTERVKIHFNHRVLGADLGASLLRVRDEESGIDLEISAPVLIGTDGSASELREEIVKASGGVADVSILEHAYKELEIPAGTQGSFQLEQHSLHIWPRTSYMLIALPNLDGSFTSTLFLPSLGQVSFASLDTRTEVNRFFSKSFPDAAKLMPKLDSDFFDHPTGRMVTVKSSPWNVGGRCLLIGDAAHAIVPFFGQGMNSGFEDCSLLGEALDNSGAKASRGATDWVSIFTHFSRNRKADADAIADMAVENFIEMRDKVGSPKFLLEKQVERLLQKEFPRQYIPRYQQVTFSRVPYREAHKAGRAQDKILAELCRDLLRPEEVDLRLASKLVQEYLPLKN